MKLFSYVEKDSFVHKLDPRSKIVLVMTVAFLAYALDTIMLMVALYAFVLLISILSFISWRRIVDINIKWGIVLFAALFLIVYFDVRDARLAATNAVLGAVRWLSVIQSGILFVFTTNPQDLVESLVKLRVPKRFAFSLGIGFRMLPEIVNKMHKIITSQRCRGFDTHWRLTNLGQLPKAFLSLFMPLFVFVIKYIDSTDIALEAKGFNIEMTGNNPLVSLRFLDYFLIVVCFLLALFSLSAGAR